MGIGLLAGFLFLYESGWTLSGLLHDLSASLSSMESSAWPVPHRYQILLALLAGMLIAVLRSQRFKASRVGARLLLIHLLAGSLMGLGAALAKGGNDYHLLLTIPLLSPAGLIAVASMLLGLYLGLLVLAKGRDKAFQRCS